MRNRTAYIWPAIFALGFLTIEGVVKFHLFFGLHQWFSIATALCLCSISVQLPVVVLMLVDASRQPLALRHGGFFGFSILIWVGVLLLAEKASSILLVGVWGTNHTVMVAFAYLMAGVAVSFTIWSLKEVY